ncbi:MAG: hypothetical protein U0836_14975 [Pirellulales bacterium]
MIRWLRPCRFSVRTLLLLNLALALFFGLMAQRLRLAEAQRKAVAYVIARGGMVAVDGRFVGIGSDHEAQLVAQRWTSPFSFPDVTGIMIVPDLDSEPSGDVLALYRQLGVRPSWPAGRQRPYRGQRINLKKLEPLVALRNLVLAGMDVGDSDMTSLAKHVQLTRVDLSGTSVTDRGLAELARLPCLEELTVDDTRITAKGLLALQSCKSLKRVFAFGCGIEEGDIVSLENPSFPYRRVDWTLEGQHIAIRTDSEKVDAAAPPANIPGPWTPLPGLNAPSPRTNGQSPRAIKAD